MKLILQKVIYYYNWNIYEMLEDPPQKKKKPGAINCKKSGKAL